MNLKKNVLYSFGDYLVEVGERRLWSGDNLIPLTPKAFETLVVLLEYKGKVLDKDFLLDQVWADTFVGESTLAQNISTLRKALGTLPDGQQLIETVSGKGYRFVADVKEIVSDEEVIVVERHINTQITAEHEKIAEDIIVVSPKQQTELSKLNLLQKRSVLWVANNKRAVTAVGFMGCLILGAVFLTIHFTASSVAFADTKFREIKFSTLTSDGTVNRVAISPDGKYLAMVKQSNEKRSILIRQLDNSSTVEILPPQNKKFYGLTFSPDGKEIYYVTFELGPNSYNVLGNLYKIPMLGGTPRQIISDVDSPIAISPDGNQYAFIRNDLNEKESALIVSSLKTNGEEKKLVVRDLQTGFSVAGLTWSPDGKFIFCAAKTGEKPPSFQTFVTDAHTGESRLLNETVWQWVGQPAWMSDGSGIIFSGINPQSGNRSEDVWLLSYPQGNIRQITNGLNGTFALSLTADANTIVMIKTSRLANLWVSSSQNAGQSVRVSETNSEFNSTNPGISWTKDGKIIFASTLNGNMDIWKMNADGTDRRQITSDTGGDFAPVATPDGRYIIFISYRAGKANLWRTNMDGSELKQLTDEPGVSPPSVSPDGRTIYYSAINPDTSRPFLRRIGIDGGTPEQIASSPVIAPKISPDGKSIACYYPEISVDAANNPDFKLTILSAEDGKVIKQFKNILNLKNLGTVEWSDNKTLTYVTNEDDTSKLFEQPIESDQPRILIESTTGSIFGFAWWLEGQKLAYEKTSLINDVISINSINNEKK